MMNWEGRGMEWLWTNLSSYPGICLEGLKKITENISQGDRCPGRDSRETSPE
jgi:hypothetical protein